jgi:DNA-binding Xre family transcriptional regulator
MKKSMYVDEAFLQTALDSLKKGKNITMITLSRLCRILDCTANDIVNIEK